MCTAMAWSESISVDEIRVSVGLHRGPLLAGQERTVKLAGVTLSQLRDYERIDELKTVNTESSQVFVAMWMDNSLDDAWEHGIEPRYQGRGL